MKSLKLKDDIYWVGSLDPELRVFDIIMETTFGTTYNSYLVAGSKKTAVFETVKAKCFGEYKEKLIEILGDIKKIDYIVVNHTEPDHAGSVAMLLDLVPTAKVVGSENAIDFLKEIANREFDSIIVKHGDTIDLGNKTLKFVSAPFLHWPDSIYTYIPEDNVLVTCDSFGSHYSFDEVLYSKIPESKKEDYMSALVYYYTAIFSPFKKYVLEAIEKIKDYKIDMICTGHGPVLDKNPLEIVKLYKEWSTDVNPNTKKTIVIPYCAAYGYTGEIAKKIVEGISTKGDFNIKSYEINIANYGALKGDIMNDIYFAEGILFGTPTINGDALPLIWDIAISLSPIVHGGKTVSAFGSYGWSGEGVPNIISRLDQLRMNVLDGFRIRFKPSAKNLSDAFEYGKLFAECVISGRVPPRANEKIEEGLDMNPSGKVVKWRCTVCGEIFEGIYPPKICPACGVGEEMFEIVEDLGEKKLSDTDIKVLIIGSGAAGVYAAEAVRERNKSATIEIITKDKYMPYYRPSVSDIFIKELDESDLEIKKPVWYQDNNIEISLDTEVSKIDTYSCEIVLGNGARKKYDKLILANGARCAIPPIQNINVNGVFVLRGREDAENIKKYALKSKKAVVIGGGVLGLEAAWGLKELGLEVEIVEAETRIFPRQLDPEGSAVLETILQNENIILNKNHFVKVIKGETEVSGVELENGKFISADMVLVSAGIKTNKEIAEGTELKVNRGIIVNSNMETNIKDIYACGDLAEYEGMVAGLWSPAIEQGKTAGANAAGDSIQYEAILHPVTFGGMNTSIFSIGDLGTKDGDYEVFAYADKKNNGYKKVYFKNGVITGGILIGDTSKSSVLLKGVRGGYTKEKVMKALI